MSASMHSQGSSRPQSTVSGVPVQVPDQTTIVHQPTEFVGTVQEGQRYMGASYGVVEQGPIASGTAEISMGNTSITVAAQGSVIKGSSEIDPSMFGENCYTHTRKVSNVIVSETLLGHVPQQDEIRYVDADPSRVPVEERVTTVMKKEVREKIVEKRVPEIEYVDRVVEVPRVEYIDKVVEVPVERIVYVDQKVQQVVDRVVEQQVPVHVVKEKIVERIVEVPGPVVEVPKPYSVVREKEVFQAVETNKPVIVAQVVKPIIKESSKQLVVDVMDFEPEVIPVDVHVAKPVSSALELAGTSEVRHRVVTITSAQYNTMLKQLNSHMEGKFTVALPYVRENGQTLFLKNEQINYIEAPADITIEGYQAEKTIEIMNREVDNNSFYPSTAGYRGCPPNFSEAWKVCSRQPHAVAAVEEIVPATLLVENRSVITESRSAVAENRSAIVENRSVTAAEPTMQTAVYSEIPRSVVETQSQVASAAPQSMIEVVNRDLAPVQTGSEVRTFPGATSLPRGGGSIRSQLPPHQPSRVCC